MESSLGVKPQLINSKLASKYGYDVQSRQEIERFVKQALCKIHRQFNVNVSSSWM
jgi:hypothetical protein